MDSIHIRLTGLVEELFTTILHVLVKKKPDRLLECTVIRNTFESLHMSDVPSLSLTFKVLVKTWVC